MLSKDEAENKDYFADDNARKCKPTDFALKNGAFRDDNGFGYWWLRSAYEKPTEVGSVSIDGGIDGLGVMDYNGLVRPALWINL